MRGKIRTTTTTKKKPYNIKIAYKNLPLFISKKKKKKKFEENFYKNRKCNST